MTDPQALVDAMFAEKQGGDAGASRPAAAAPAAAPASASPARLSAILRLRVPVIVRLAERQLPLRAVLNWTTGSIIEFDKPAEEDLDLLVNNVPIARGQAVKVGEKFGLRITRIRTMQEKISALGGKG